MPSERTFPESGGSTVAHLKQLGVCAWEFLSSHISGHTNYSQTQVINQPLCLRANKQSESVNLKKQHQSKWDESVAEKLISVNNGEGTVCLSCLAWDFVSAQISWCARRETIISSVCPSRRLSPVLAGCTFTPLEADQTGDLGLCAKLRRIQSNRNRIKGRENETSQQLSVCSPRRYVFLPAATSLFS